MIIAALLLAAALDDVVCVPFEGAGVKASSSAVSGCPEGTLSVDHGVELSSGGYVILSFPSSPADGLPGEGAARREEQVCTFAGEGSVALRLRRADTAEGPVDLVPVCPVAEDACSPPGLRCHRAGTLERRADAAPEPARAQEVERLLLLDLEAQGVAKRVAGIATDLVRAQLERVDLVETLGVDDVELLMDDAQAAALDACDAEAAACLAEAADALGARYQVSGALSTSDHYLVATLSLIDSQTADALSRVEIRGLDLVDLSRVLPPAIHNLLGPLTGERPRRLPPPLSARTAEAAETVGGAAVAGGLTGAGLFALVGLPALAIAAGMATSASLVGGGVVPSLLIAAFALPCAPLACGCAALGSVVGDLVYGYEISPLKAAALFLAGAAASTLGTVAAGGLSFLLIIAYIGATATLGITVPAVAAFLIGLAGLYAVFGLLAGGVALTTGMAFDLLTPVFAEEPPVVEERPKRRPQRY